MKHDLLLGQHNRAMSLFLAAVIGYITQHVQSSAACVLWIVAKLTIMFINL